MSTIDDPAKLKVVELRAELSARGLDTKGNKPVLVKRLKDALEQELQQEIPDTSIADTSTEDSINISQDSNLEEMRSEPPDRESSSEPEQPVPVKTPPFSSPKIIDNEESKRGESTRWSKVQRDPSPKPEEVEMSTENNVAEVVQLKNDSPEANGENIAQVVQPVDPSNVQTTTEEASGNAEHDRLKNATEKEQRGDKRRRSSPSPQRVQRKRSKSPIKEDEPNMDNDKVQLSWVDSDLHLQVNKENFLSAKPCHEGAFGYAWAGARATHGIKQGKVCFEVKITEALKWEDVVKQPERGRRDNYKLDNLKKKKQQARAEVKEKALLEKNEAKQSETAVENVVKKEENPDVKEEIIDTQENLEVKSEPAADVKSEEMLTELKSEPTIEDKSEPMEVEESKPEPIPTHLFRVGWSLLDSSLQLGESKNSFGFESSGKFVSNKQFTEYGVKFAVGDVVGSYVNIDDDGITLIYTINGEALPVARKVARSELPEESFTLLPHVLSRNYVFEVNFGDKEEPWYPQHSELSDYIWMSKVENTVAGPTRPETRAECEVVMMCGLPASGKTHWVREWVQKNVNKRYDLIGNTHLLERMTVNGSTLKSIYKGRWNVILDKLMKCSNRLVEIACLRRRNFIIDQTNVFPSAQRRKMRSFEGFKRRAVVVVVNDEEQAKRQAQQEAQDGKDVPESAIFEMKANMTLPRPGDWLDEVTFAELGEEEAKAMVQKYNKQGREAGFGPLINQGRGGYRDSHGPYRWDHNSSRRDYRGYRDRGYHNTRFDRRHGGWHNRRPGGGSWSRDMPRDGRGPPPGGSRDWRNSSGGNSGRDRDHNRNQGNGNFNNRNQRSISSRGQGANYQGVWQNQGNWAGSQGNWTGQGSWAQGQSGWGQQGQWKGSYGPQGYGQGYGSNYANWNYYGQYAQNWNPQNNAG